MYFIASSSREGSFRTWDERAAGIWTPQRRMVPTWRGFRGVAQRVHEERRPRAGVRWRTPTRKCTSTSGAPSRNWPPLSRMDIVGIAVAGLATGALLINMAHVVGILFFESVDYHGPFQRFFARLSMFGTAAAVTVSLAIGLL